MNNKAFGFITVVVVCLFASLARAATTWSTQDYDLYSGDFNGDGKTDILYIAKDPSLSSGIATSDGTGPNIPWQSWQSNYLGIQWYGGLYVAVVGDFNHDGKADILLQRTTPGDSYLLLADSNGRITQISQGISNSALGLSWSRDQHVIITGDFDGDGRADLFLQATSPGGVSAIVFADANGQFTQAPTAPNQFHDGDLGFPTWSSKNTVIDAGDFDGDGKSDLLVRSKPNIVMIDYDIPIPVPVYKPNSFGVVLSQGGSTPFQQVGVQQWSRNADGVDWSPNFTTAVVGDFNGDGRADVILQSKNSSKPSYLLTANASGSAFSQSTSLSVNVALTSDSARLIAGNFDSVGGAGLYIQSTSSGGTNYFTNTVGASISASTHDPATVTGVVPATAVGRTAGSFAVSNSGSAGYSVPIVVPKGVAGIQPSLSLSYSSGGGNGLVGVGWGIGGLSEISRCGKTLASDGVTAGIALTANDRLCLDGNKLRLTSGTHGTAGSVYQTEIETFSRITAYASAGNGPAYFIVEGKDGLYYRYGYNGDSRILVGGTSTARVWAIDQVSDRAGNVMTISYKSDYTDSTSNGGFRPNKIQYTTNAGAGLTTPAYEVDFVWETRPSADVISGYFAGGLIQEQNRLKRIETRYNGALVRKYQLSYNTSSAIPRSRLASIQECEGATGTCLSPTMISWRDGTPGWSGSEVVTNTDGNAKMDFSQPIDFDGDGRTDLIFPLNHGGTYTWAYLKANAAGGFDPMVDTGVGAGTDSNPVYAFAAPIDLIGNGRKGLLVNHAGYAYLYFLRWTGSTLSESYLGTSLTLTDKTWIADINGDGLEDIVSISGQTFYVYPNTGGSFSSGQNFYSTPTNISIGDIRPPSGTEFSPIRIADFNADGKVDLVVPQSDTECEPQLGGPPNCVTTTNWLMLFSTGTSFVAGPTMNECVSINSNNNCPNRPLVADFNGDGISDVAYPSADTSPTWFIQYGTGAGLTEAVNTGVPASSAVGAFTSDYDGDGRADIFFPSIGTWSVLRSTGTGLSTAIATSIPSTVGYATVKPLDIDGDGLVDIGYNNTQYRVRRHLGVVDDLVSSITDGFGNNVAISYAPLTDSSVYTKGISATFPEVDIQAPMYVVKQYSANDGIGGSYSVTETYSGARAHLQGRGYEGFATRVETDLRTNIKATQNFRQDFPFVGKVAYSTVTQPNGLTIASTVTNYADFITNSTSYADRHFPYPIDTTQTAYEVSATSTSMDGAPVKSVVTSINNLDLFGNPTSVTATTTDLTGSSQTFTTTTTSTVTNDTTNWCLGFVTQSQVATAVPNAVPLAGNVAPTRTLKFDPDPDSTKCRVYKQTVEPGSSTQVVTTFQFDSFGHTKQTTVSAAGVADRVAAVDYGSPGVFTVQFTNAEGEVAYKTYDYALDVPLIATDANGLQVSWQYDGFGRRIRANAPDGTATTWTLYACTITTSYCGDSLLRYQVVQQQLDGSASHNVVRSNVQMLDAFDRSLYSQTQTFSGAYSIVRSIYDNQGRLVQRSAPYFAGFTPHYSSYSYDLLGRLLQSRRQVSDSDTTLQTIQYGYAKLVQSVSDPLNHTATQTQNAIGQVVQTTDAIGNATQYQYDALGNLAKTTDSASNQIVSTFNLRGFKVATSDPDMGDWSYDYYPTGELKTQTDAKNQVASFTYDGTSRALTRSEPEGTTIWTYGSSAANHNIGQLQSISGPGGYAESYAYDSLGRPQNITYTEDTTYQVDYTYNNQGSIDTLTYPTSTSGYRLKLQYAYANGQLAQVRDFAAGTQFWTLNATNAANQAIDESLANGVRSIAGFDSVNGAISYRQSGNSGSTSNLQNLSYQWDKAGNLKQRQDALQNLAEVFNYDALNRLDNSTLNGAQNLDVTVNAIGNLTLKSDVSSSNYDYTTPQPGCTYYSYSQPHAVRKIGGNSYCYDQNGNMTSRAGSAITWTSYNLPSQINSGSNFSQFSYGPSRQRWKQVANYSGTTETTIYVGGLVEKVSRNGITEYKHYIAGGSATVIYTRRTDGTASTFYVASDHLGSSDVITDGTGAAVVRESFAAYGARRGSNWTGTPSAADQNQFTATTRQGYTGHEELDNLNLIHMNGRVYDPQIGRFISADPFIQAPMNQQSLNRYSYVMNGPMSATDPSGYLSFRDFLNPFSHDNPLSPVGTFGKYIISFPLATLTPPEVLTLWSYKLSRDTDHFLLENPEFQPIVEVVATAVATYYGGPLVGAYVAGGVSAHFTRINGGSTSDILRSFVVSFSTSYAFSAASEITNPVLNTLAQAAIGCGSAAANGGNCGQGALSAGFGAAYTNSGIGGGLYGAAIAGGIGSELGGGDFWEGAKMAGLAYIVTSALQGPPEQAAAGQSGSGTAPAWANDPNVAAEMNRAWIESNPNSPAVPYGQLGSLKVEQGGWVMQGWFSSGYDVVRVAHGTRDSLPSMLGSRPSFFCFCTVKGWFHTHPNTAAEHYLPFIASPGDMGFTRNYAKVPGVIKTPGADIYIPYP